MAEYDVDAMLDRFRMRADAVKERGVPPLEGAARRAFIEAAEQDYTDYMMVSLAKWSVEGGYLTLSIPLSREAG